MPWTRPSLGLLTLVIALSTATNLNAQTDKKPTRPATQEEKDAVAAGAAVAGAGLFGGSMLCVGVSVLFGIVVYGAPTLVALLRGHANMAPILVVNWFLGWTLIGWVVALAWAFTAQEERRYRGG